MGRIVAIDYGRKRVGIAVTDPEQRMAFGLDTVKASDILEYLKKYMEKEKVDCFVVGYPKQMNNSLSEAVEYIDPFIRQLGKIFPGIPVEKTDERFTSKMATQTMIMGGVKKKDRRNKALLDTISATIILQSFLEQKNKKNC